MGHRCAPAVTQRYGPEPHCARPSTPQPARSFNDATGRGEFFDATDESVPLIKGGRLNGVRPLGRRAADARLIVRAASSLPLSRPCGSWWTLSNLSANRASRTKNPPVDLANYHPLAAKKPVVGQMEALRRNEALAAGCNSVVRF